MAESNFDDVELKELFRAFDTVHASSELKESTIAAALAETEGNDLTPTKRMPQVKPRTDETLSYRRPVTPAQSARTTRRARPRRLVLIGATVAAVLVALGITSWFVPISNVRVEQDEFVVDLGVNVYGVTVSASAEGDEGKTVLEAVDVRNVSSREATDRLRDAYQQMRQGGEPYVTATVTEVRDGQPEGMALAPGEEGDGMAFEGGAQPQQQPEWPQDEPQGEQQAQPQQQDQPQQREWPEQDQSLQGVSPGQDQPQQMQGQPTQEEPTWGQDQPRQQAQDQPMQEQPMQVQGESFEGTPGGYGAPDAGLGTQPGGGGAPGAMR